MKGPPAILRNPRFIAVLAAAMLATAAAVQLRLGADSVPRPMLQLSIVLFDWQLATAARALVAIELALAAAIVAAGARFLTTTALVAIAFTALACISAAGLAASAVLPSLTLACAAGLLWLSAGTSMRSGRERRGLSPAWTALFAVAAGTAASVLTAGLRFTAPDEGSTDAKSRAIAIDLDLKPYVGRPVAESPIATYLPRVAADLGNETTFIVFYNPRCDACHTLFRGSFSQPRPERIIAVEIPPASDAIVIEPDYMGPIECPTCEFESLPPGPLWLVAPPMTVKIEGGVIVCVADRFGGDCVNPP